MSDDFIGGSKDGTHIFDDFHSNSAITTGLLGNLNWDMTTIAHASTPSFVASPNGVLRLAAAAASGDGEALTLKADGVVLVGDGQVFRCRVRYPNSVTTGVVRNSLTGNNFRIGFGNLVTAVEHSVGVFLSSDAGVLTWTCANTTTDVTGTVTGIPTLTGGTTMVLDKWHDLELRLTETNVVGAPYKISCLVDGYPAGEIVTAVLAANETMEFSIVHYQDSGAIAHFDIDYYEAWIPRFG